jgi:hypothetical protein
VHITILLKMTRLQQKQRRAFSMSQGIELNPQICDERRPIEDPLQFLRDRLIHYTSQKKVPAQ